MRAGTHRDLQFWANGPLLNAKNRRRRLGPIDQRHSGSKHAVFHPQINRRSLGPIETSIFDAKVAVLNAQYHR